MTDEKNIMAWYVTYIRPGGEFIRLGPMQEQYATACAKEYHRKGLKDVTLEKWGPVEVKKL